MQAEEEKIGPGLLSRGLVKLEVVFLEREARDDSGRRKKE